MAEATPAAVTEATPATVAEATLATVAEVGFAPPPAAIVIDDSPPDSTTRAGGRVRFAEVVEERRAEKRARVEVPLSPSSPPPTKEAIPPPPLVPWVPDIVGALGRPLAKTDCTVNPQVVAALG